MGWHLLLLNDDPCVFIFIVIYFTKNWEGDSLGDAATPYNGCSIFLYKLLVVGNGRVLPYERHNPILNENYCIMFCLLNGYLQK